MNNKYLLILVSVLLIVALYFGYLNINQAWTFIENKIDNVAKVAQAISNVSGIDFNDRVDFFLPDIDSTTFGSYVYPDGDIRTVSSTLKSFLPSWMFEFEKVKSIKVYPTFYSADFLSHYGYKIGGGDSSMYVYTVERIVRMRIEIGQVYYDCYVWYPLNNNADVNYFITLNGTNVGYYSTQLNSLTQYMRETERGKKLNSVYTEYMKLVPSDDIFHYNTYDSISNVQSSDIYIAYSFEEFYN